jgi:hypothetical protein
MPVKTPRNFSIVRPRLAAVMTDDQRRELMREFIDEVAGADADLKVTMEWTLETWLQWLRKKREAETSNNVLTFRVEKGAEDASSRSNG